VAYSSLAERNRFGCESETTGGVFDIGGPEALCYRDIMSIMAQELGLARRWVIPVPVLTPRLSSYWIQFITPLSHEIAKPLAEGLKNPVVCREDRIKNIDTSGTAKRARSDPGGSVQNGGAPC
jgi:hypothetical protein